MSLIDLDDDYLPGIDEPPALDESEAERQLWRLSKVEGQMDRLRMNAADMRKALDDREAELLAPLLVRQSELRDWLVSYRRFLENTDPRLPKSYQMIGGVLTRRKGVASVEVDDLDGFVAWAEANRPDLLRRVPERVEVDKAAVKAAPFSRHGDNGTEDLIDAGGEVVPGVRLVTPEDRYDVVVVA